MADTDNDQYQDSNNMEDDEEYNNMEGMEDEDENPEYVEGGEEEMMGEEEMDPEKELEIEIRAK